MHSMAAFPYSGVRTSCHADGLAGSISAFGTACCQTPSFLACGLGMTLFAYAALNK